MLHRPRGPELLHPAPLCAALLLALNDHVLKDSPLAGWWTGKLSDFAGLFVAPIVAVALFRAVLRPARDRWLAALVCAATAAGFAALKLAPTFNAWTSSLLGENSLDPTDLIALPSVLLAYIYMSGAAPAGPRLDTRSALRPAALTATALACMATSRPPPRPPRPFPAWTIVAEPGAVVGCARAVAWVSKSGKTGMGVTLELVADRPCELAIGGLGFAVGDGPPRPPTTVLENGSAPRIDPFGEVPQGGSSRSQTLPATLTLDPQRVTTLYVGYQFDNEELWNRGAHTGHLILQLSSDGDSRTWQLELRHQWVQLPVGGHR